MLKIALNNWVAKMAATTLNFGTVILLSRNLGAENRGICAFYTVIIAFCLVFNELAAGSTTVYLQQSVHWKQIRKLAALWSLMASGIICFVFWWVGRIDKNTMFLLWLVSAANGIVTIQYNILLGHRKYLTYNLLSVLTPLIILVSLVVLVLLKMSGPFNYLLVIGVAVMVALVAGYWSLNRLPSSPLVAQHWWVVIKKSFGSGFLNQAGHVVSIINSRYIFYLLPAASLGVFTNALSLAESMLLVPGSMGQIYYSQAAAKQSAPGNQQANAAIFKLFFLISLSIMLLGILVIWAVPDIFYTWLFGPQFAGVKPYLLILSAAMFLYSAYLLISYFQSAAGKFERNVVAGLTGLFINIIGVFTLYLLDMLTLKHIVYLMVAAYGCTAFVAFWQYWRQAKPIQANR